LIAAIASSLLGLGALSQVVAPPNAEAAGVPASLPMQGVDPNWTKIPNMQAVWAPALNPDGSPMADPTNGGMGPLNSDSVYWTSDSSTAPTGVGGTTWILGESYNFNADLTSYQTRSVMTVQRTAAGGGTFNGTALDTQAMAPIGGTYGETVSGKNVPLTMYMWNDAGAPSGLNAFVTCPTPTANYIYVLRVTSGDPDMYVGCMPAGGYNFNWPANPPLANGFRYGTGGEADQYSGYLFVQPMYGTLDNCGWNSVTSCRNTSTQQYIIWDPQTGNYVQSGAVVPADFSATTTTTISQVRNRARATSASVNANPSGSSSGPAWVNGGASDITADFGLAANGDLFTYAGVAMPTSGVSNISLLRISPSKDASGNYTVPTADNPWTYNVTTKLTKTATGAGTDAWPTGSAMWGTGIHNGKLLVTAISGGASGPAVNPPTTGVNGSASLMLRVDPLTGSAQLINSSNNATVTINSSGTGTSNTITPATTTLMRDAASPQQLSVIEGYVYNDVNGKGDPSDSGFQGVPGVELALYDSTNTMVGDVTTDSTGVFSFITSGTGTFTVRVVQPQINGVNAVQTWGGGYTGTSLAGGPINSTTVQCRNVSGGISTGAGEGTTMPTGQPCNGAMAQPYADPVPTMGSTGDPSTFPIYATVNLNTDQDVAYVDFGVTTMGSYGDSTAGPDTVANNAPVHVNGLDSEVWFGQVLGNYAAPAMDSTSHNATFNSDGTTASGSDDGIYIGGSSLIGNVPVATAGVLAATRPYTLKGTVSGTQANDPSTYAAGWTTPAGSTTLTQTPAWTPTISNGVASGAFTAATAVSTGAVQLRTQVSTGLNQAITHYDNSANEYQAPAGSTSATQLWTTPGEIEDYAVNVAAAVYRPAVKTSGGTISSVTFGASTFNDVGTRTQVGTGVGVAAGATTSITATVPAGYYVTAQLVDTEGGTTTDANPSNSGQPLPQPTITMNGSTATVAWDALTTGDDVTVLLTYTKPPSPADSTLSCTPTSGGTSAVADGNDSWTCTATVKDADGNAMDNEEVQFTSDTGSTLSVPSCMTSTSGTSDGQCSVTVTSTTEGAYKVHASINPSGDGTTWAEITGTPGSPQTVTFVAGPVDRSKSTITIDNSDYLDVTATAPANTHTVTVSLFDTQGAPATQALASGLAPVCPADVTCSTPTGSAGVFTFTVTTKVAGSYPIQANYTDPTTSSTGLVGATTPTDQTTVMANFKAGVISSVNSTFTCTPMSSSTATPTTPVANGTVATDNWTCVVTANDDSTPTPNPLTNLDVTKFHFTQSTGTATQSTPVVSNGDGTYTVKFYSTKADATNTVTADYDSTPVGSPATVVPIPFKAGPIPCSGPAPCDIICPVNGKNYVVSQVYAAPNSAGVGGTSSLTVLLADKECNPITGATATFTQDKNATISSTTNPATTNADGLATSSVTDSTAETVTIGGTYDASNATSNGIAGNYGSGNLTSDTTSLGGTAPAATGTSMVQFTVGGFDPSKSAFIVAPAVDPTSATKTDWVVADGSTPYSGYVAAYDASGNPLTSMSPSDFVYNITGTPTDPTANPSVKVTYGAQVGNKYYVTFTTNYAAASWTVTAAAAATPTTPITGTTADGATVTTWANGAQVLAGAGGTPIPFQAGSPVGGSDTPVKCSDGRNQSWIEISSASQAAGTPATATVHLTDANCNPVTNTLVSFTPTGAAFMTPPTATTNAQGVATSDVNDYSAQPVQVRASSGSAVVGPVSTTFTAGPPSVTPYCTNNTLYPQGTQLIVGATMVQLKGTTAGSTSVDAYVTDQYCNPVTTPTNVNFAVSPVSDGNGNPATTDSAYLNDAAGTSTYTMQTDSTGHAITTLADTNAETVNVKAQLSSTQLIKPTAGVNVMFATGDFNGNNSSFTCVVTTGSATPPVANGSDSYTCTIVAKDSALAPLPSLGTGNFAFNVTSGSPAVTTNKVLYPAGVKNNGDGTYTVVFTSTTADSSYKVTASYAGEQIVGGATIVPTAIPFTFGQPVPPDTINPTCADGRAKTNTATDPKTQTAGTPVSVTTLITDKDCNPVQGATVNWTVSSTTASVDSPSLTTGSDGTAKTNLNDKVAEYVLVSATATGAGVTSMNAGSDSATFTAGDPVIGPVPNCPTATMTGSNVSALSPIQVGGTSTVTAKVTDANCNPVTTPVTVNFTISSPSNGATISTTPGSSTATTNSSGIATATATDNMAETAKVTAMISQGPLYAPNGTATDTPSGYTQAPVVFQAGAFSGDQSIFTCAVTSGSSTPPVADGTQSYTCTITAKDGNGNGLTTTDPSNPIDPKLFEFGKSTQVDASAVTEVSATSQPGVYKVSFTTLKSDDNYTVMVSYNGIQVSGSPTVVPTPIPFQSGAPIPPDPNQPNCVTGPNVGSPKTYTQATPTTTQAGDTYSTTVGSLVSTYVTDSECNPVVGASVTFTQDKSGTFKPTTALTDKTGMATTQETDTVAETTKVTSTVTYTDPNGGGTKVTAGDDGTVNVTFTAGNSVPEVPGDCPDGTSGHVNGTHLSATSPQGVTTDSTATAYITDEYCNPVGGVPVSFTVAPTATASLTGASPVSTGAVPVSGPTANSGKAVTTFTDSKAEVASITATIQINGVATPIYASAPTDTGITGWTSTTAAPSRFTVGDPVPGTKCVIPVDGTSYTVVSAQVYPYPFKANTASTDNPQAPMTTADPQPTVGTTQSLRTYLFDEKCNPVAGVTVAIADGTPASGGPAAYTMTQATTGTDGMAAGGVYDELAETAHPAGTYTSASSHGNLFPAAVTFKASTAHDGPNYTCGTKQGTHLSVDKKSTQVTTNAIVQAYVTDEYCNPIDGAKVDFSFTGATGLTPPLYQNPAGQPAPVLGSATFVTNNLQVATVGGYANVTVTDSVAETINVRAVDEYIGDVQVTFTPGAVDRTKSTLTCAATSSATGTPVIPVADDNSSGSDYYTCTITAKDANGNTVTDPTAVSAADFNITPSSSDVKATALVAGTGANAGTFTSKLTSKVANPAYTATATFGGASVGAPDVVPVPFKAGQIPPGTICTVNGQQVVVGQIYAYTPGTTTLSKSAVVASGATEGLKVFLADADCNPIAGVNVTITPSPASPVVMAMGINPTGADGWATATASDTAAETVAFPGTYSSPSNGSGSLWAANVTWAPAVPTITGPTGTVVTDKPTITGTGSKPGDTVTVTDNQGRKYCTATVQADLSWSCNPDTSTTTPDIQSLPTTGTKSAPSVTAKESDSDGNSSAPSAPKALNVDTSKAAISGPIDGSTVVTDKPPIKGDPGSAPYSGDPNNPTTVDVTVPDPNDPTKTITVCTADVQADGSWTCTPTTPLPTGTDVLTPVVHDTDGGTSPGTPVTVKVDKTSPTISTPKPNTTVVVPRPPIKGTAPYSPAPNPTIVTVTDNTGKTVCTAEVQKDGTWSCTPAADLPSGNVTLTPTVTDASGNKSPGTPIVMNVNTNPPTINPINPTSNAQPTISGTGAASGDKITVKDSDGTTVCTTTVNPDHTWSCTPSSALGYGDHGLKATETDLSGNNGSPSAPVTVSITAIVVQTGGVVSASGMSFGGATAGGFGLAGVWVAIAAFRRREEAATK